MTLVVGKVDSSGDVRIEADTRTTSEVESGRSDPLDGRLKAVIVNPWLCVCFAGNVRRADDALRSILAQQRISPLPDERAIAMLLEAHQRSRTGEERQEVEFAVASLPDERPRFRKIANGVKCDPSDSFWLGEPKAAERFEQAYLAASEKNFGLRMGNAFQSVARGDFDSVGDFHITVCTEPGSTHPRFGYLMGVRNIFSQIESPVAGPDGWLLFPGGSAARGAHACCVLRSYSSPFPAAAIHLTHGRFGILFCPQISLKGMVVSDVSGVEFIASVEALYGIRLMGLTYTEGA